MVSILQVFYSVFSAVLLSLAIPNEIYLLGCPSISLIALVPLYIALSSSKSYKEAWLVFFIQVLVTHLISSFWLAYFKDFAIFTLGLSGVATGAIGGFFGLMAYLPFAGASHHNQLNHHSAEIRFTHSKDFKVLYFAVIYTLYEWAKSSGFLGYPWGTLSSTAYRFRIFMQIADITGQYGVTFLFALINALIAQNLIDFDYIKPRLTASRMTRLTAALVICSFFYGLYHINLTRIPQKTLNTIMVQQNSDPWKEKTDTDSILRSEELTQKELENTRQSGEPVQLIAWSEGNLKYSFPANYSHYWYFPIEHPLLDFIKSNNIPLLTGGSFVLDAEKRKYNNAALMFDGQANLRGHYGKNHLVPFAEAIPGIEYPVVRQFMINLVGISAGWTPGDQYVYFDIPGSYTQDRTLPAVRNINLSQNYSEQLIEESKNPLVRIATPICFDDSFADIMRPLFLNGAELFMNITDDSWSLKKSSEFQHFVIASYSAIEYRTTLARSTNAGYSVVLDPAAKILADMPLFELTSLSYKIPVYQRTMTVYARLGNWLPFVLAATFFAYAFYSFATFQQSDYIPSERKLKKKHKKHKR